MRVPTNEIVNLITSNKSEKDILIKEVDETITTRMYELPDPDWDDKTADKYEFKYNKYIEKLIRGSYEYRTYIGILKNEMNLTKCRFLDIVDISEDRISFEMHHYPFDLYSIVDSYRSKLLESDHPLDAYKSFKIAEDIMEFHYKGIIGLVPLSYTAHELAHSGEIFIPLTEEYVFGNWREFLSKIKMNDYLANNLSNLEKITNDIVSGKIKYSVDILDSSPMKIKMVEAQAPMKN
jgi:hypothetical protein